MAKMKAAVFVEPGRIVLDDKPVPDVGPGEALVRVTTTTIGGTDVNGFASDGYVRIGDEILGYTRVDRQSGFVMPERAEDSAGLFRGAFGTEAQSFDSGELIIGQPYRFYDRFAERADAPEMAHGAMLWGAALYNNGAVPNKHARYGESYSPFGLPQRMQRLRRRISSFCALGISGLFSICCMAWRIWPCMARGSVPDLAWA